MRERSCEQIKWDLQCGRNGRGPPSRSPCISGTYAGLMPAVLASATWVIPRPVTDNRDRTFASGDAIGDDLRNDDLAAFVECAACTRDEAAGTRILFGFDGERSQALVFLASERREVMARHRPGVAPPAGGGVIRDAT